MPYVGKSIPHESAPGHVAGTSIFIDDMPPLHRELIVDVVGSPIAHGRIKYIDIAAAQKIPGIVAVLTAKDIPGHNIFGPVIKDEHLLAEDEVIFIGDPVVLIAAETREAMKLAKKAVKLTIEPLPALFSIDDAIAANSYTIPPRKMDRGNVDDALKAALDLPDSDLNPESLYKLTGEFHIGGQEHFYLESQAALAVPGEDRTMTVHSSTQHTSEVQSIVAEVIGYHFAHVNCICKRMGGGFGGKETQAAQPAAMSAVIAAKTGRPARIVYTKDDDMKFTGKRHPFKAVYKVAFTGEGLIRAIDTQLYSNGGCTLDLSAAILERAMLHSDNAYFVPNLRVVGRICKTNLPSNTAFRGFGGPQGVAAVENIIEEVARAVGKDALDIRRLNCYGSESGKPFGIEAMKTQYGQIVRNNVMPQLLDQLKDDSNYSARRAAISAFNEKSKTKLKGLSTVPVKFGISFTHKTMNQANALVLIYQDGTVSVTTGATEMGQGVYTRIRQLVADDLGLSFDRVLIGATTTDKNNNTSPSAASATTDLNGAAALDATTKIKARLAELAGQLLTDRSTGLSSSPTHIVFEDNTVYDSRNPLKRIGFTDLICAAYLQRVNLGERGFYATPGIDFDRDLGKGNPFLYYTNGAACAEVTIDRFTGDLTVDRVDILMDAGIPLNPAIDRGQIIGGFIQGMGWCTTEELKYAESGALLSYSPTTYKIPNISDTPAILNMSFFDNPNSEVSIKRSKALGEPPLLLGLAVWAAAKNALAYTGKSALSLPATNEQILIRLTAPKKATITISA